MPWYSKEKPTKPDPGPSPGQAPAKFCTYITAAGSIKLGIPAESTICTPCPSNGVCEGPKDSSQEFTAKLRNTKTGAEDDVRVRLNSKKCDNCVGQMGFIVLSVSFF